MKIRTKQTTIGFVLAFLLGLFLAYEMYGWASLMLGGVVFVIIDLHLNRDAESEELLYKWICLADGCSITIRTNDLAVLERISGKHMAGHRALSEDWDFNLVATLDDKGNHYNCECSKCRSDGPQSPLEGS